MRYWEPKKQKKALSRSPRKSIALGGSVREYPFLRQIYQHQAVISDGIQKFLFFLVIATLLYAFVFGDGGAIRIITLKNQRSELAQEVAMAAQSCETLEQQIERSENDPFMMEKLGRERYGYVNPGDHVYKIVRPERTDQQHR